MQYRRPEVAELGRPTAAGCEHDDAHSPPPSLDGRPEMRPGRDLLERGRGPKHGGVLETPAQDLQPDGQLVAGEPAGHRGARVAGHVERIRERDPIVDPGGRARDLAGAVEADLEGRAGDGRRQQEVVALEEPARMLLPGEAGEPGLNELG